MDSTTCMNPFMWVEEMGSGKCLPLKQKNLNSDF